jgi:hypothetical protein
MTGILRNQWATRNCHPIAIECEKAFSANEAILQQSLLTCTLRFPPAPIVWTHLLGTI